jgi:hypothetical protein
VSVPAGDCNSHDVAKGTRHDMFAHGCLSVRMNTPTEQAPFHLHLTI